MASSAFHLLQAAPGSAKGTGIGCAEVIDLFPEAKAHGRSTAREATLRPRSLGAIRVQSYLTLLGIDAAALAGGFILANLVRFGQPLAAPGLTYLMAFLPVFLALSFSSGAYSVEVLSKPRLGALRVLKALVITGAALLAGLFYAKTSADMSRAVFGVGVVASAAMMLGGRHLFGLHLGTRYSWTFRNEVLLVDGVPYANSDHKAVMFAEQARLDPVQNSPEMLSRIGTLLGGYDRIILSCDSSRRAQWVKRLKGLGIDVEVLMPELDFLGALAMRRTAEGSAVLVAAGPLGLRERIVKRIFDVVVASTMLLLFAPLMLFVALAVKVTSPGPVLFRQMRIGRGNMPISVLKFRTMRLEQSDFAGCRSAQRGDSRLTSVGAFLRRTSIDELPQLLNVLKGDMSIVGPRPHAVGSTAEDSLFWDIDERYWQRGAVKPGITGLAQVRGYRGATSTVKDLTDRVHSDLEYLSEWSVGKDIAIMLKTVRVLVHPNAF
jgi:exopolysaccharide biosynthesis polyprenyl glycosylphosphotransferase